MSRQDEAELAALADGSLTPDRRRQVEARVAASPELAGLLAQQQRAVALAQNAAEQVATPASLREGLNRRRAPARKPVPRRLAVLFPAAVAAVIVAAVVGVFDGSSSQQSLRVALASPTGLSGSAKLTKTTSGWRIELKAADLPRLDNGRFYEAWLRNSAGVLVPVGTFNDGRKVTLWAGVSPKDFQTLTVTRERADGDQTSSGKKVLVGTVDTGSG
jgi:anti-sigma-K factor RskA